MGERLARKSAMQRMIKVVAGEFSAADAINRRSKLN
jgi:hypothetical protein